MLAIGLLGGCASQLENAVESGDLEATKRAIEKGGNVEGNYYTSIKYPLDRAIQNNDLPMIKFLHANGATVYEYYLLNAAAFGSTSTFEYLLANGAHLYDRCGIVVTDYNIFKSGGPIAPPLGQAAYGNHYQATEKLISLGAPITGACTYANGKYLRYSVILIAAEAGNSDIVQLLLSEGADPNTQSARKQSALAIAAENGHLETVRTLLAAGAYHTYSIHGLSEDKYKQPIEFAQDNGHEKVVQLLKYSGAKFPYRHSGWDTTKEVAKVFAEAAAIAVIAIATIYLISEGLQYSNYSAAYAPTSSSSEAGNKSTTYPSRKISIQTSTSGCRSDFDCSPSFKNICLKKPFAPTGICVQQIPWDAKRDLLEQAGHRSDPLLEGTENFKCPAGFWYDIVYRACVN